MINKDHLRTLIPELKTALGRGLSHVQAADEQNVELPEFQWVVPDSVNPILHRMLEELGEEHEFRTGQDCLDFVIEYIFEDIETIIERLADPVREYHFSTNFSDQSVIGYQTHLGGKEQLELSFLKCEVDAYTHSVSGVAKSFTSQKAIREAEKSIGELVGSMCALELGIILTGTFRPTTQIAITIQPNILGANSVLSADLSNVVSRLCLLIPNNLTDIERSFADTGEYKKAIERHMRILARLFSSTSPRAKEIRNSARLYLCGYSASEYGMSVVYFFMSLEALLLEGTVKDNVQARLAEAIAYKIGHGASDRRLLRQ